MLIADDHPFFFAGFASLLPPKYELVGTVENGRELLIEAERLKPDVNILDIKMPELDGIEAARRLRRTMPDVKLLFLTMYDEPEIIKEAWLAGASAYIHKSSCASEVFEALQVILEGRLYVSPQLGAILAKEAPDPPSPEASGLTTRQHDILRLLAQGKIMREVAKELGLSPRTVADHKYRTMKKLGIATNAELVRYAIRYNLI